MATRGIQEKLSNGTVTEVRIGSTADTAKAITQGDLNAKNSFGTGDNVTEFELATGHQVFKGNATVWEDDNVDPTNLTGNGEAPDRITLPGTGLSIAGFAHNKVDEVEAIREFPHKAKLNAAGETSVVMSFHTHVYPAVGGGGDVVLLFEYLFSFEGVPITTSTTITQVVALGTEAMVRQTVVFPDVVVPEVLGAQLFFRFSRLSSDGDDTFSSSLGVSTLGYHYEIDGGGSRSVLSK